MSKLPRAMLASYMLGAMDYDASTPPNKPAMLEVLYFGWSSSGGHTMHSRDYRNRPQWNSTPWGSTIDTGLCPRPEVKYLHGQVNYHIKDGWSAIAFWDRSGDKRPGSNTVFLVAARIQALTLLDWACVQWPEVFARPGFPLNERIGKPLPIFMPGEHPL